jgi:hypothetical protein
MSTVHVIAVGLLTKLRWCPSEAVSVIARTVRFSLGRRSGSRFQRLRALFACSQEHRPPTSKPPLTAEEGVDTRSAPIAVLRYMQALMKTIHLYAICAWAVLRRGSTLRQNAGSGANLPSHGRRRSAPCRASQNSNPAVQNHTTHRWSNCLVKLTPIGCACWYSPFAASQLTAGVRPYDHP